MASRVADFAHRNGKQTSGPERYPEDQRRDADESARKSNVPTDLDNKHYDPNSPTGQTPCDKPDCPLDICIAARSLKLVPMGVGVLTDTYPTLREPLIEGLLRVGETMNIISAPKVGKSWTTLDLAFAVGCGYPWLGFPTRKGRVLLIDNELHPETLAHRIRTVAETRSINIRELNAIVEVISLRGRLTDIYRVDTFLESLEPGAYSLVVLDAFYRALPIDTDENSNAQIAGIYNVIDRAAGHLRAGFANVHHSTKGLQSQKSVTDVGAGAGSQSRAVDCHLVFRPHKEDDVMVLDAACRSWPPVAPRCLRWSFPTFTVADDCDPNDMKEAGRSQVDKSKEREGQDEVRLLDALDSLSKSGAVPSVQQVRDAAGFRSDKMKTVVFRLKQRGIVKEVPTFVPAGKGARETMGLSRC